METEKIISLRRSVRIFNGKKVDRAVIEKILLAGQSAPSAVARKDWYFIVVENKALLQKMREANGLSARPLESCAFAVVVCGDRSLAYEKAPDYCLVDAGAATQNMLLQAADLGVGSVWLGTWPQSERVEKQREIFALPEHIVPYSVIAFGYTDEELLKTRAPELDGNKVRYEL